MNTRAPAPQHTKNSGKLKEFRLAALFLLGSLVLGSGVYVNVRENAPPEIQPFISTFEECAALPGSIIMESYPRQCRTVEKKTYIEDVPVVPDTSSWMEFTEVDGFTFKCPPNWSCFQTSDFSASVSLLDYVALSTFEISLITPTTFQQSRIRHPQYRTPVAWLQALRTGEQQAVIAQSSTIRIGSGTDGKDYPAYHSYDLTSLSELDIGSKKWVTVLVGENGVERQLLYPLTSTDVIMVALSPEYLQQDSIVQAVLSSIVPE